MRGTLLARGRVVLAALLMMGLAVTGAGVVFSRPDEERPPEARPPGVPGDEGRPARGDVFGDPLPPCNIHDRYRTGIGNVGVAHICGDQNAAVGIECQAIRLHAHCDFESIPLRTGRKHRYRILAPI